MSRRRPYPFPDAVAAAGIFLLCWGLVHTWFWGHGQLVDWPTYEQYGRAIWNDGRVPYRDFAVEYPPGALPAFVASAPYADYASAFAWSMCACGVALVAAVAAVRREAAYVVAFAPVLAGSLILSRFDLWPALLLVVALAAVVAGRDTLGWSFLGAAVAAKLWPLVVVPLVLVWSWRRGRAVSALAGLAVAAAAFVPFFVVAPRGVWESLHGQASRPLQIESVGASLFTAFGHPQVVSSHGSQNIAGHGAVGVLMSVAQVATLVALWIAYARGAQSSDRLLRYSAASVCAFVAFSKVLSPQYVLWLIPLVPLVRGRRGLAASAVLVATCVLTQVWFPLRYWDYVNGFHLAWVVLLRNVGFVLLLVVLAWPGRIDQSEAITTTTPGRA